MFGLKIFVRVQTFRWVPPVLPRNFCHPDVSTNEIICHDVTQQYIFHIIHICNIPDCICIAQQCALAVFMWAQMGLVLMLGLNPTRSASVIPKYLRSRINCDSSKNATILRPNMKKFRRLLIQLVQEVKYAPIYLCQDQNLFWIKKIPLSYYALHRWLPATTVWIDMFGLAVKATIFCNIRRWMDGWVGAPRSHTGGPTPTAGEEKQGRFHSCLSHIRCREESRECCRQIKRDPFTARLMKIGIW